MSDDVKAPTEVAELLRAQGKLTDAQYEQVCRCQQRFGVPQHRALQDLNYVSEEDIGRSLAELQGLEFVDLAKFELTPALVDIVPVKLIFHYHTIPVALEGDLLTLAFSEPPSSLEQGNLRLLLGRRIRIAIGTPSCIHAIIKKQFGLGAETIQKMRDEKGGGEIHQEVVFDVKAAEGDPAVDATISAFVDQMLMEAMRLQATDLHMEPYHAAIRLRYRIDGVMEQVPVPAHMRQIYPALVSRLKIMAGLNIAEKRLPHDGRISMKTGGDEYDLRVSIIPTRHGEAVCLRVLGRQNLFLDLGQLGMEPAQEKILAALTDLPQGLVLITGPTGSGKTTTLYAALARANDATRKIITIEDPVEYQLEGTMQIQTREDIGLTFSSGLRSVLRHDPDVVLIGEIRDPETAEIAVRAAQTGHMVFSTLHTNDSISAVTRLIEMGIDPFLVGTSLVCSIAQRLVRRICRHCVEPDPDIPADIREEMAWVLKAPPAEVRASKGRGCVECGQKGQRGRLALYEFFLLNDTLADLIAPGVRTSQLRDSARRFGWVPLRETGLLKVHHGLVNIPELQSVTRRLTAEEV